MTKPKTKKTARKKTTAKGKTYRGKVGRASTVIRESVPTRKRTARRVSITALEARLPRKKTARRPAPSSAGGMDPVKRARLEAKGWKVSTSPAAALGMSEERFSLIKLRVDLGDQIRAARTAKELTQAQLAKRLKTKQPHVARMETGHPGVSLDRYFEAMSELGMAVNVTVKHQA